MAGTDDEGTPPGWYRQPDDPRILRWWDGQDWTDDTMAAAPEAQGGRRAGPAEPAATPARPPASTRPQASTRQPGSAPRSPNRSPARSPAARSTRSSTGRAASPGRPTRAAQGSAPARRRAPGGPGSSPDARRAASRPAGTRAPGGTAGARRPATGSGARRPGTTPARTGTGAARSERVVRRRPTGPGPGVTIALRALLIAAVVGVLYLGYVQLRDAAPPDARTVSEDVATTPDEEFRPVSAAVLGLDDLPAGWAAQAHDPGVDDICLGRIPRQVLVPADVASASFTQGASGPYLTNVLARFDDEDGARAYMDLTERVVESCREYEANGAVVRLGPLDYPRFGEDTFVAAATGESQFGPISGRIVYVRVGTLVASVETIAFGDAEVSDDLVEHLSNELAKRLRAL